MILKTRESAIIGQQHCDAGKRKTTPRTESQFFRRLLLVALGTKHGLTDYFTTTNEEVSSLRSHWLE